jgi:hypothetical protein
VKSMNHVDHHRVSTAAVVCLWEASRTGNVSVQYPTPVSISYPSEQREFQFVFEGSRCEIASLGCSSNPCRTGTCVSTANGGYQCICPPLTTGINCDVPLLPCASNPCLNNATCLTLSAVNYTCLCPPLFTGLRCSQQIVICPNNPCQGNSTCIVDPISGLQICQCSSGRYGVKYV